MSSYAILVTLFARERLGIDGQLVDVSMIGSLNDLNIMGVELSSVTGKKPPRQDKAKANNPLYHWYKCKDGIYLVFALLEGNRYWPGFCRALGITDLENDPRFAKDQNVINSVKNRF